MSKVAIVFRDEIHKIHGQPIDVNDPYSIYNPVVNKNGDVIISEEEIAQSNNPDHAFLKEKELKELDEVIKEYANEEEVFEDYKTVLTERLERVNTKLEHLKNPKGETGLETEIIKK